MIAIPFGISAIMINSQSMKKIVHKTTTNNLNSMQLNCDYSLEPNIVKNVDGSASFSQYEHVLTSNIKGKSKSGYKDFQIGCHWVYISFTINNTFYVSKPDLQSQTLSNLVNNGYITTPYFDFVSPNSIMGQFPTDNQYNSFNDGSKWHNFGTGDGYCYGSWMNNDYKTGYYLNKTNFWCDDSNWYLGWEMVGYINNQKNNLLDTISLYITDDNKFMINHFGSWFSQCCAFNSDGSPHDLSGSASSSVYACLTGNQSEAVNISNLINAFDIKKILTIDPESTKRWKNEISGKEELHATINCNTQYFEASLGTWQTNYWLNNNWITFCDVPTDFTNPQNWTVNYESVINLINTAIGNGKFWCSNSSVNNYAIPQSGKNVFGTGDYLSLGTYTDPNINNKNSIYNLLNYAWNNRNSGELVSNLLPTVIGNTPTLSWKKACESNSWTFDDSDFISSNLVGIINSFLNSASTYNDAVTINYEWWAGANPDGTGAGKVGGGNLSNTLSKWMKGVSLESFARNSSPDPYDDIRISTVTLDKSMYIFSNDLNFGVYQKDNKTQISLLKEIDAIDTATLGIYRGNSVLTDSLGNTVVWNEHNFRWFCDALNFISPEDLVTQLNSGSIYINEDENAPLYHFTINNIDASMFCQVGNEWTSYFGTNVIPMLDSITPIEYSIDENDNTVIDITITSSEGDTKSFSNDSWGIKENMQVNEDSSTVPDVSSLTADKFIEEYGDTYVFMQGFCKFQNSTITNYFFELNITEQEWENDIKYISNPVILSVKQEIQPDKTTKETLAVTIMHPEYYFSNNQTTFDRNWITEDFEFNGFIPLPAPPSPFNPVHQPYLWIIYLFSALGVCLVAGGGITVGMRIKRRNRRSSIVKQQGVVKANNIDINKERTNKFENDKVEL